MSEQEKKWQRIYDLLNAKTKPKFLCLPYTKQRKNFTGKEPFKEKVGFLIALTTVIKKDSTTSIKKSR